LEAKLYSPVFCDLWDNSDGDSDTPEEISQGTARWYFDEIQAALLKERLPDESKRGLMEYYHETDSVDEKVRSLFVDIEIHGDKLWAVATLDITESLTTEELDTLKDYLTGQYSDGFGEGFEQRDINTADGALNVHLWSYENNFYIDTQEQFSERTGINLPADALSRPETPAQAALHEPDALDSEEGAELREQLMERINDNLARYMNGFQILGESDVIGVSNEIAAMSGAHYYLSEIHNFHKSELDYLLQFKDPLKVVADEFEWDSANEVRSDVMWKIFHEQGALRGDYELAVNEPAPAEPKPPSKATVTGEKPSVLEQIREATKAPAAPHKEKTTRDKSEATI